jgi:hypothetical protein
VAATCPVRGIDFAPDGTLYAIVAPGLWSRIDTATAQLTSIRTGVGRSDDFDIDAQGKVRGLAGDELRPFDLAGNPPGGGAFISPLSTLVSGLIAGASTTTVTVAAAQVADKARASSLPLTAPGQLDVLRDDVADRTSGNATAADSRQLRRLAVSVAGILSGSAHPGGQRHLSVQPARCSPAGPAGQPARGLPRLLRRRQRDARCLHLEHPAV